MKLMFLCCTDERKYAWFGFPQTKLKWMNKLLKHKKAFQKTTTIINVDNCKQKMVVIVASPRAPCNSGKSSFKLSSLIVNEIAAIHSNLLNGIHTVGSFAILVFPSRIDEKQIWLLTERSRQLWTNAWVSWSIELAICLLGTFLVHLAKNNKFRGTQISFLFLTANF